MGDVVTPTKMSLMFVDALKLAHKQGWLAQARDVFRKKYRVLLAGATGTGKTNMVDSLTEVMPAAISYMNRSTMTTNRRIRIGTNPFDFIDMVEDDLKGAKRARDQRRVLRQPVNIVVNVVSFGYHEYRVGRLADAVSKKRAQFKFLEQHRQVEIDKLTSWAPVLGDTPGWLITLINKADLWWDRKDEVLGHYQHGTYADELSRLTSMGVMEVRHVVAPYCAVFHKFYECAPMCGVFDDAERVRVRAEFLKILVDVVGKPKSGG